MATILRQERKKGVNYRIQIPIKDVSTGKHKTITLTWTPPEGLSKKEQERAATAYALDYEKKIKQEQSNPLHVDDNITVREYSKIFLEQMEKHTSANYYASCKLNMPKVLNYLGNYKLKELKPLIIQNFIDSIKKQSYIKTTVIPKPMLNEMLKLRKMPYVKLAALSGTSVATVKVAVSGRNVAKESADKIANALQCPEKELFTVINESVEYSTETQSKIVRILKHMMTLAKRFEIIDKNYASAEYVKGIEGVPHEAEIMDLDEALDAIDCLEKEENIKAATAIMIGIYMGRRRGEVAGLKWSDLDLKSGDMDVQRSRTAVVGMGVIEKAPKSQHSAKNYSMPSSLTRQLIKYKAWWKAYVESLGDRYKGEPYLFLQDNGTAVHPSTIYHWLKNMQKKYGLKDVNYHSLRKTNISVQYASNLIPSEVIADRAGHADDKVTKKKYMTIYKKDDKKTAQIVDAIFTRSQTVYTN